MSRVKRGTIHVKRRRKLMKSVKGFKWGRKNLIRLAKTAATKAGTHSYFDRKKKKSDMRGLWLIRINAFVREFGLSYSVFINKLKTNNIKIDRKILADMAINNKEILSQIVEKVK